MPLVEIITTSYSSPETISATLELAKKLGKTPILVKDSCGFLVNRILLGYINEAGYILTEGGSVAAVDRIMTDFGMPMGPFTLSDEVGLDVGVKVLHILQQGLGDRFKPVEIFEKIYAKGLLGKKSEKGFYFYGKNKNKLPNPEINRIAGGSRSSELNQEECLKRMLYVMINEAARCLEEGVVDEVDAVDLAMILGTGFPPFRGGLLRYARSTGIENIVRDLNSFENKFKSERFRPCGYLKNLGI